MKRVKITKIDKVENSLLPTPTFEDYKVGEHNEAVSLPMEYWIEGELLEDIKVGEPIRVHRDTRNGVKVIGVFCTSTVQHWDGQIAQTLNSKYLVQHA